MADPVELGQKLVDRVIERRERQRPPPVYVPEQQWEARMHELIGADWPCPAVEEFRGLWSQLLAELSAAGIRIGRGAFGGWGDGEPAFTRACWCLSLHLNARTIVETGVARGVTSRFMLEALGRNRHGHLWSIDLPPLLDPTLAPQVGVAVPQRLRPAWSYVRGSSRQQLPKLLRRLGRIDLFVHDSRHSERNLRFELDHAWTHLRPGGVALADDIDVNHGFGSFVATTPDRQALICVAEPLEPDPQRHDAKGLFGFLLKQPRNGDDLESQGAVRRPPPAEGVSRKRYGVWSP